MITKSQQNQAAAYVLGALSAKEAESLGRQLVADAGLRELVAELQKVASALPFALATPSVSPPARLKKKILMQIHTAPPKAAVATKKAGFSFERKSDRDWAPMPVKGVSSKLLSSQAAYDLVLVKCLPGVRYPSHPHEGPEECYVIAGDMHVEGETLHAGDFHHAEPNTVHKEISTKGGCTLLLVIPKSPAALRAT